MTDILFQGKLANGETKYVPIPIRAGAFGAQIIWLDAVSAAALTVELTSVDDASPTTAGVAGVWKDSGLVITGPAAAAADSALLNVDNCRQKLARLKIVPTAISNFLIVDGTTP